jgi:MFS family permease
MCDVLRKRVVACIGLALNTAGKLCIGFFPVLALFPLYQILQNVGFSLTATALTVMVADTVPKSRMSEGLGYYGLNSSLATAVGPGIALATVAAFDYLLFYISLALYLVISGVFILVCRYENDPRMIEMRKRESEEFIKLASAGESEESGESGESCDSGDSGISSKSSKSSDSGEPDEPDESSKSSKSSKSSVSSDSGESGKPGKPDKPSEARKSPVEVKGIYKYIEPSAIPYAIVSLLYSLPMGFILTFLPLYAAESGIPSIGLFFTFSAVTMVAARLIAGKAADKYGTLIAIVPAVICYIAAFALILIAPASPAYVIWIAGSLYGFAGGIINPVLTAKVIKQVPHERRGAASGTFTLSFDVGISGGAAFWGYTIQYIGYAFTVGACVVIGFAMLAASFPLLRERRKNQTI